MLSYVVGKSIKVYRMQCWGGRGEGTSPRDMLLLLLSRFSCVQLCATPQTAAHQAPLSLGFSRQEHWSGLPFPSPVHESEKWKWSCSVVSDSPTPWTEAYQAPLSMGFSRQEYWSGVPLPSPAQQECINPSSLSSGVLWFLFQFYFFPPLFPWDAPSTPQTRFSFQMFLQTKSRSATLQPWPLPQSCSGTHGLCSHMHPTGTFSPQGLQLHVTRPGARVPQQACTSSSLHHSTAVMSVQAPQPSSFNTFFGRFSINRKQLPCWDSPLPPNREIVISVHFIQANSNNSKQTKHGHIYCISL